LVLSPGLPWQVPFFSEPGLFRDMYQHLTNPNCLWLYKQICLEVLSVCTF
jgi:hypothetical protein